MRDSRRPWVAARYDPDARVVVAAPGRVRREWRFVVVDSRPVASSLYTVGGEKAFAEGSPGEVRLFAERVLADVPWRPEDVFILDVAETDAGMRVVELNGFSCSGLYRCDPGAVIGAISELLEVIDPG